MAVFFIVLAVIAGSMLPVQGVLNSQLGRVLDNVVLASMISFIVGALTLLLLVIIRSKGITGSGIQALPQVPPVLYLGGVLGALLCHYGGDTSA